MLPPLTASAQSLYEVSSRCHAIGKFVAVDKVVVRASTSRTGVWFDIEFDSIKI